METPHSSTNETSSTIERIRRFFPTPEDWVHLQGGKPRVFHNPRKPQTRWVVLHVYDEHGDPRLRFQSGAVVDTLPPKGALPLLNLSITATAGNGQATRDVTIPSFMYRPVHGDECAAQSAQIGGQTYPRITSQPAYEKFINHLAVQGFEELRFGMTREGLAMLPYPAIRPPRPLTAN